MRQQRQQHTEELDALVPSFLVLGALIARESLAYPAKGSRLDLNDILAIQPTDDSQLGAAQE